MKKFSFEISFFLIALFLSGVYYYQEGSFKISGILVFAAIFLILEVSVYLISMFYKKYKQSTTR